MFYQGLLPYEIPIMDHFIKHKVRNIRNIVYKDYNGYIPRIEVPYLIRYFLQFPSQSQVVDEIIPAIEKLESSTDKSKEILEVDAVEDHLINLLKSNTYVGYAKENLIEAFRVLDVENNGYLDLHTFYAFLKRYGTTFTKEQIKRMEKFLLDNDNELLESLGVKNDEMQKPKPTTTRKFYYESYVRKVFGDNQAHFENIMREFKAYYDEYKEKKEFPPLPEFNDGKEETEKENVNKQQEETNNVQNEQSNNNETVNVEPGTKSENNNTGGSGENNTETNKTKTEGENKVTEKSGKSKKK